jgi:1-acyl-sn-glycerol-3-phosphate acyltransferase
MRRAEPGVAYVADKVGVPVIPVGIVGTTDDYAEKAFRFKRPPLEMRIGKPMRLPPVEGKGAARHQSLQANTDMIMRAIAVLLPPEYQGVYTIN